MEKMEMVYSTKTKIAAASNVLYKKIEVFAYKSKKAIRFISQYII